MITSLAHHPNNNGPIDFSHLFLSSSVDWTVKLWKSSHAVGSAAGNTTSSSTPVTTLQASSNTNTSSGISNNTNNASRGGGEKSVLFSFEEAHDYIYDTKWSPTHPAVFGYVDGSGKFDFYNLNIESEVILLE